MRKASPAAVAFLLVAACSHTTGGQSRPASTSPSPPPRSVAAPTATPPPAAPPGPDKPVAEVISWIEAGTPADVSGYHVATSNGTATQLGTDVAFVTPSGKTRCMTDSKFAGGALACLVQLTNSPPRPADAYGEWIGGWVDFDGASITIGGIHGDPGRFLAGDGPQLPYGKSLKFGDYQCRAEPAGLYCANYAHQSAARLSDAGIVPFGCAKQVTPPPGIGEKYVC